MAFRTARCSAVVRSASSGPVPAAGVPGARRLRRARSLLNFSLVRWVWWPCGWEAVGVACQPSPSAAVSSLPPLSRPQLAEARRVRAVELFEDGVSNAEIARAVGVCSESVRRWRRVWEEGGASALRRRAATGRPPKLDDAQVETIRAALEQGAQAHGVVAGLWTLERVGAVVERATGVVLSRASVWRLLTGRLGWSLQRPERRAVERDESETARWIAHEWPRIKIGAVNIRAWSVFLDESGVSLLPQIRRTYSPRGRTSLLRHRLNWKRASMAGALGYHSTDPDRGARLCFHLKPGSYDTAGLIEVLE
ncbi:IS630 family transposase [Streptomyces sp. NBC_01619]|nr:IS630 family transposase [Streptomyces sp. NBC_01619]